MQLHEIRPGIKKRLKKRVGRGGKRGTYSGRGQKGQKSRSGHRIRPAERDLIMRIPKLRGIKNKPKNPGKIVSINVGELARLIKGTEITRGAFREAGIIEKGQTVKILGSGNVARVLSVKGLKVSEGARKKIEAAGGTVK